MQNVEFKAELRDVELARRQCEALGASCMGEVIQTDTYFRVPDGRLKRREVVGQPSEWVFYHRANGLQPRVSNFVILTDDEAERKWGTVSLRPWLVVRKKRELWRFDNVRIHLDDVEGLGRFIEFEARVLRGRTARGCTKMVARLREKFGLAMGEPVSVSYSDLVAAEAESRGSP
jgi:adenylate cyclase class IV